MGKNTGQLGIEKGRSLKGRTVSLPEDGRPRHAVLTECLQSMILRGEFSPGSRLPTEAELGRQFGVSRITVRRSLRDLADRGLVRSEQGRGSFVSVSEASRALNFLFVHSDESDSSYPYTALILEGIRQSGQFRSPQVRIEMIGMPEPERQSPDDTYIEELVNYGRSDGVVAFPRMRVEAMGRLVKRGVPVVAIGGGHYMHYPPGVIYVGSDPVLTMKLALGHFVKLGRKRVGVIAGDPRHRALFYEQLCQAAESCGLEMTPHQYETAGWGANYGEWAAESLLARCPDLDAIYASDDLLALGALHHLWKRGISCPGQIALIGVGNLLGEHSHSGLTTVDVGLVDQGRMAGESIRRILEGSPVDDRVIIHPKLILRETA